MRLLTIASLLVIGCGEPDPPADPPIRSTEVCWADRSCAVELVVSHKADGVDEPENSLAAIAALADAGVHAVEVDPRLTSDGHFVLMHDEGIKRTTSADEHLAVSSLTLAEVQAYALKDDRCPTPDTEPSRCRIPTLAEALDTAKGRIVLLLDIKDLDLERLVAVLNAHHGLSTSVVRSKDLDFLSALTHRLPGLLTMEWRDTQAGALDSIENRGPLFVQVEPSDLDAVQAAAAGQQVRVMISTLTTLDPYLWAYVDSGALDQEERARAEAEALRDQGVRLFLTSYPIETQRLLTGEPLAP